ncbi:MAG: F0F1 ATP synthase subunit B [Pseudomonadales bacterium]|nr:F0F1 ATP synthase subunit B [Pseudomonadales bacterium]
MTVDWVTVSAQIVNFLVLVWLLQRFLYRPVLAAMDRREARIAERLQQAAAREDAASAAEHSFAKRTEALDAEREALLAEAREAGEAERSRLVARAREEAERMRRSWTEEIERERDAFLEEVRSRAADGVVAVARRALTELAGSDLDARAVERFLEALDALPAADRDALLSDDGPLRVSSARPLAAAVRETLAAALRRTFGEDRGLVWDTDPTLVAGLELSAGGRRLGWALGPHLDALAERLRRPLAGATALDPEA